VDEPPEVALPAAQDKHEACPADEYKLSEPHGVQNELPALPYLPAAHCAPAALEPSHVTPALQAVHVSRAVVVPPPVELPGGHSSHRLAPAPLYNLSAPQSAHALALPAEYLPAAHDFELLEPSAHSFPAGHGEQAVRVVTPSPPLVYDPALQVAQVLAPAAEYSLSSPHAAQVDFPTTLCFPAGHLVLAFEPSHAYPPGHELQVVRVLAVHVATPAQSVYDPAGQVAHDLASAAEYLVSPPQLRQLSLPMPLYVPAAQLFTAFVPSQSKPAGQAAHVWRVAAAPPSVKLFELHVAQLILPAPE